MCPARRGTQKLVQCVVPSHHSVVMHSSACRLDCHREIQLVQFSLLLILGLHIPCQGLLYWVQNVSKVWHRSQVGAAMGTFQRHAVQTKRSGWCKHEGR